VPTQIVLLYIVKERSLELCCKACLKRDAYLTPHHFFVNHFFNFLQSISDDILPNFCRSFWPLVGRGAHSTQFDLRVNSQNAKNEKKATVWSLFKPSGYLVCFFSVRSAICLLYISVHVIFLASKISVTFFMIAYYIVERYLIYCTKSIDWASQCIK